jgi:hypothetical protein
MERRDRQQAAPDHHLRAGHGLFEALAGDAVDAAIGLWDAGSSKSSFSEIKRSQPVQPGAKKRRGELGVRLSSLRWDQKFESLFPQR